MSTAADMARIRRLVEAEANRRVNALVKAATLAGERAAKKEIVSGGSHPAGTPTTARRGVTGPALVTGNARRNVTSNTGTPGRGEIGVAGGAPYVKYLEELGYPSLSKVPDELRQRIIPRLQAEMAAVPWPHYT